jgi:hypothetical protein
MSLPIDLHPRGVVQHHTGRRVVRLADHDLEPEDARELAYALISRASQLERRAIPLVTGVVWIGPRCPA